MTFLLFYTLIIFTTELIYFRIAKVFNIIDRPNQRSSHVLPVIRGGGIIFIIGIWVWSFESRLLWPYFLIGITLVSFISFLDDVKPQAVLLRFFIQTVSILFLFYQVGFFEWGFWLTLLGCIICVGTLNSFNFMDGINGISGIYAVVNLATFLVIDRYFIDFTDSVLLNCLLIATGVFLFYNCRKRARCFAGDVGSVTLAFVQIFFLLQLTHATNSFYWILLFLTFGIDSVVTIMYRLKNRENIFIPHRSHLYQVLANELALDHRLVSILYGAIQVLINILLIYALKYDNPIPVLIVSIGTLLIYYLIRLSVVRKIHHPV